MIPERFCIDYPTRVLMLLERLAPQAVQMDLSTTFIVSLAMPMLVVPFERLKTGNPFSDAQVDPALHQALEAVKSKPFSETPFWREADRGKWHFAHVVRNVDNPSNWKDVDEQHPLRRRVPACAAGVPFGDIITTMRHGLSHGCVVYLDENGAETPRRRVTQVAFLANASGGQTMAAQRLPRGARRLVAVEEQALRAFLSSWCRWLSHFNLSSSLRLAA